MPNRLPLPATPRALVWFKRDLRQDDHAPLAAAQHFESALGLYIIEPDWLASPEFSTNHLQFALDSLAPLRASLAARGLPLLVRVGAVVDVLAELQAQTAFTHLLSHEETGPMWTYARDIAVAAWCAASGVQWQEWTQTGVVRRLRTRFGWAKRWQARMDAPRVLAEGGFAGLHGLDLQEIPTLRRLGLQADTKVLQTGAEASAWAELDGFLDGRGRDYRRAMSSPLTAPDACSRLSPHLAFGTISMRTVHQATEHAIAHTADRNLARALRSFSGRLRWHCHFMQKLEDQPSIEYENFASVCDGLRENDFNTSHFDAWCAGQTGYPMVDACMRSLNATGWLNFRMRAMLVSFASYHLWLHWRPTGMYLARQFLDFEAGIHWSQMQMQSGTTGINTLRMYSPTKQALDQDPDGAFIRHWVPELARVPLPYLAEPWKMNDTLERMAGCVIGRDYPAPIVDDKLAVKAAKDRLYGLRKTPEARAEADAVQSRHGSRKSGMAQTGSRRRSSKADSAAKAAAHTTGRAAQAAAPQQPDLFADTAELSGDPSPGLA
jgi:deoxyribodipyrimidine photo-lyase